MNNSDKYIELDFFGEKRKYLDVECRNFKQEFDIKIRAHSKDEAIDYFISLVDWLKKTNELDFRDDSGHIMFKVKN